MKSEVQLYKLHKSGSIHTYECPVHYVDANWHGPYASRGAAIDAALALNGAAWKAKCCMAHLSNVNVRPPVYS